MVNYVQLSWNNGKWCLTECQKMVKYVQGVIKLMVKYVHCVMC